MTNPSQIVAPVASKCRRNGFILTVLFGTPYPVSVRFAISVDTPHAVKLSFSVVEKSSTYARVRYNARSELRLIELLAQRE
jgi:hypothetical protein